MYVMSNVIGKLLKVFFGLLMVGVVVAIGVGIYFFFELGARPSVKDDTVPFRISAGETFADVANDLHDRNLIRNVFVFLLQIQIRYQLWP